MATGRPALSSIIADHFTDSIQSHIRLTERKALAARLVFAQVVGPQIVPFIEQGPSADLEYRSFVQAFKSTVDRVTNVQIGSPLTEPLDRFLMSFFDQLASKLQFELRGAYGSTLNGWLEAMRDKAATISCNACSGSEMVCDTDRSLGDRLVSYRGLCIDPLREMFSVAWGVAKKCYEQHSSLLKNVVGSCRVGFATELALAPPHSFGVNFAVSGLTDFTKSPTVIKLKVFVAGFDWETYCSVPYVLFHECICHAFQNAYPRNRERAPADEDGFLDGWMDWVALKMLELEYPENSSAASVGAQFHAARIGLDLHRPWAHRALGVEAAKKLFYTLKLLPGSYEDPWRPFLEISCDLDVLALSTYERTLLIRAFGKYLPPDGFANSRSLGYAPHQAGPMHDFLNDYLESKDIQTLVVNILSLSGHRYEGSH